MDTIISQLYQIESTASSILERAQSKKKQLAVEHEERIQAFERQSQQQIEEEIRRQKEQMNAGINAGLERERQQAARQLSLLEQEYQSNHTALAQKLLKDLLKE